MSVTTDKEWIQLGDAPEIPGLTFRYFQGRQDYPEIVRIFNACKRVDGVEYSIGEEDIAHNFDHLENCDPFTDMVFAEIEGEAIAYSRVGWYQESQGDYIYYALGWLDPQWRRKGIGTAILKHNEARLQEIASDHPAEAIKWLQNDHNDTQAGVAALLETNGYQAIRWGLGMRRPITDPLPEVPLPDGLEVRPVKEDQYPLVFEASNEAFRDHWGHSESSPESYQSWLTWPFFNPKLWKVAWDGDQVAGMVLNWFNPDENREYGRQRGWTDPICVRRQWRRRGLARALLVQSVIMFQQMGFGETALDVDTQNPNQALHLYTGVGYKKVREEITYRKPLYPA